jgi:hypothetical protein
MKRGRHLMWRHWQSRWQQGHVGTLARTEQVADVEWRVGAYPPLVLEYTRLVRAGVIRAAKDHALSGVQRVRAMAGRFARGVKRVWAGTGENDDEIESWVESAGTRTLARGDLRVGEVFARHGPPPTAHSAAAAAKERTAAANRQQVERMGQDDATRAADKLPASPQRSAEQERQRQKNSSNQPGASRAAGKRPMVSQTAAQQS